MDRHTLHDAATNAASQNQSSHSYSAWRTAQQTQPRIFQYNPQQQGAPQQSQQPAQGQQGQQQEGGLALQGGAPGTGNLPANIDKNIIFANAQQYNLGGPQQQSFSALQRDDPSNANQSAGDPNLGQSDGGDSADGGKPENTGQTTSSGRVLSTSKRAAQNRTAQRAFRQRKDRYIKSLEQKATDYDLSHSIIADLRKENIYLRDYVVRLQNEVDSLNSELGRAPMFAPTPNTQQRNTNANQGQQSISVNLAQAYPIQIDPQTAAVAAAAAAANVHSQDNQAGLTRLAPADTTHNAISMPAGNDQSMDEAKVAEAVVQTKKGSRGRKRKGDVQAEAQ